MKNKKSLFLYNDNDTRKYSLLKRQINCSMIYYLLTECEGYSIKHNNSNLSENIFFGIQSILKDGKEIFDFENVKETLKGSATRIKYQKDQVQLQTLSQIIQEETGLEINFKICTNKKFEISEITDIDGNEIDIYHFIEKYYQYNELISLVNSDNEKHQMSYLNKSKRFREIEDDSINQNEYKWKYQKREEIQKIVKSENVENESFQKQLNVVNRRINEAMINYLKNECENYSIQFENDTNSHFEFIYIKTIKKGNKIVYDKKQNKEQMKEVTLNNINRNWKKNQMKRLAELIENESGMKIVFEDNSNVFQIIQFVDIDDNPLDLYQFVSQYNQQELSLQSLTISNDTDNSIKRNNERFTTKWIYQDGEVINQILENENESKSSEIKKRSVIIRIINCCMLYYLLKECEGYSMTRSNITQTQNNFFYISKIMKRKTNVFKERITEKPRGNESRIKNQLVSLSELIQQESGIEFSFCKNKSGHFELKTFVDEEGKSLNLYDFVKKYYKFDILLKLIHWENEKSINKQLFTSMMFEESNDDNEDNYDNSSEDEYVNDNAEDESKSENKSIEIIEIDEDESLEQMKISSINEITIENRNQNDNESQELFLSSFNSTLLSILNKLHYTISFINPFQIQPKSNEHNFFLKIKSIQKETEQIEVINDKYQQIKLMMELVEDQTTILFLFEIDELKKLTNSIDKLGIKDETNEIISINQFNKKYQSEQLINYVENHFKTFPNNEYYQMNYFIDKKPNELKSQKKTNNMTIWKINEERIIDEWKRIIIYFLLINGYSITFYDESIECLENYLKYLKLLKQCENDENNEKDETKRMNLKNKLKQIYKYISSMISEIDGTFTFNENNNNNYNEEHTKIENELRQVNLNNCLMIKTIEKNQTKETFSINSEIQMKKLIEKINKESGYQIVYNETQTMIIPQYLKLKSDESIIFSTSDILSQCDVNDSLQELFENKIEKLTHIKQRQSVVNQQFKRNRPSLELPSMILKENNVNKRFSIQPDNSFPKNYLRKRNDYDE